MIAGTADDAYSAETIANMELSHGAAPLDGIIAELDGHEKEWAQGAALYGPGGLFNDQRKAYLATVYLRLRDVAVVTQTKVTESALDHMAHADEQYKAFINSHETKRADWLALNAHRDNLIMRVNRGQAMLKVGARMVTA